MYIVVLLVQDNQGKEVDLERQRGKLDPETVSEKAPDPIPFACTYTTSDNRIYRPGYDRQGATKVNPCTKRSDDGKTELSRHKETSCS